jgi:hypothetical protein
MEEAVGEAEVLEKKYDWVGAADLYCQALCLVDEEDFLRRGEFQERISSCFYRAAFQAESQEEFRDRMRRAIEACEKASDLYAKLVTDRGAAWMFRSEAICRYLEHWITPSASEKLRLLDDCLELERKALTAFWGLGDKLEFGKTYNALPEVFYHAVYRAEDVHVLTRALAEGVEWGEKAVTALRELGEQHQVARAYLPLASYLLARSYSVIEGPEKQATTNIMAIRYLREALDISEKFDDEILSGCLHYWLGYAEGYNERAWKSLKEAVKRGEGTRDNLLQGEGLSRLAHLTMWKANATEDPEKRRKIGEEAMMLYDEALRHLSITSFYGYRGGRIAPPWGYIEYYCDLGNWETDPERKLELLDKAVELGTSALKVAEDSPMRALVLFHYLSKALTNRAVMEPDIDKKRTLLQKALYYREINISRSEPLRPFAYWDNGVSYGHFAMIRASLASIEPNPTDRRRFLEEAIQAQEKCLQLMRVRALFTEKQGGTVLFIGLNMREMNLVSMLTCLHELSKEPEHLRRAIETSRKAIESARKVDNASRVAESYWRIAQAQDALGEHSEASESFQHASVSYAKAAEKIPQLGDFYQDYVSYMQAWSEIEKGKQLHEERDYGGARGHYEKAAALHKATKRWNYLYLNYHAWSRLEEAEHTSRREESEEAREAFQESGNLFAEAKKSIEAKIETIEAEDEKKMASKLAKASESRREYCQGRMALEEARILDRQGDHKASSRKYGSASDSFQSIMDSTEDESDRRELKPIIRLCQAWEKMTRAEAETSPELYLEASRLFDVAKEQSFDEKSKVLALGHSLFCKALEAGTRFEETRDMARYSEAKKHIEAATNHYVKAGFLNASEYAKATYRLFDAYAYMYQAQTEMDVGKKNQLYQLAERILQASAGSYIKAKHPEKGEQIHRLLESVREEQQLAMSLTEVLHPPTIVSATTSFATPAATYEQAVGLERFEYADIQAQLMPREQEALVGEDIRLDLELVNTGKMAAQLIKIKEILPEGFKLVEKPEVYRVEDSDLIMKGKNLAPLRTEEVKLVLTPLNKGTFQIKPRILYLDEAGKYKSHEPEPATVVVKELGISGWLKGKIPP